MFHFNIFIAACPKLSAVKVMHKRFFFPDEEKGIAVTRIHLVIKVINSNYVHQLKWKSKVSFMKWEWKVGTENESRKFSCGLVSINVCMCFSVEFWENCHRLNSFPFVAFEGVTSILAKYLTLSCKYFIGSLKFMIYKYRSVSVWSVCLWF